MVGDILRRERERQKLSVKDIEQGTSIRAVYIEAIENGEYDKLPGNVYTKGFIKNYGNFLKLEGDVLSRQFTEEVAPPPPPPVMTETNTKPSKSSAPIQTEPQQPIQNFAAEDQTAAVVSEPIPNMNNQRNYEQSDLKINSSPKLVRKKSNSGLLVAAIILIAAIAGGLWYYFTNIEGTEIAQNQNPQTQTVSNTNTTSASASTPDSAAVMNGVNLQAKFNDRCWTKVVVDGRIAYEGTAEAGQTLNWQATDRISVTAGNAGAVEFIENGRNLGTAGAVGDVIEKTFVGR